jgi:RNA polymerase sigma-70 factor (ECF subfamily)
LYWQIQYLIVIKGIAYRKDNREVAMFLFSKLKDYKVPGDVDEALLWKSFCNEEKEALSKLFRIYYGSLLDYGKRLVSDEEAAKDGIQKLFLKLWRKRNSIGVPDSVKAYLIVSYRRILLRRKEQKLNRYRRNQEYLDGIFNVSFSKEELIVQDEIVAQKKDELVKGINQLSGRQKETLFLKYYHGLTNKEIAEVLEINHQSVKNNLYRAFKNLKGIVKSVPSLE